jgi:hypothetical protein
MTGMGEVEGSDAYHGPDDLLPPESLVTHGTVPTRQLRHKRSGYIMPGRWSLRRPGGATAMPGRLERGIYAGYMAGRFRGNACDVKNI